MKSLATLFTLLVATVTVVGCASYHRGSTVPQELREINIPAFENHTEYPMAGAMAAQQLMDAVIEDGTFKLREFEDAKLRVQVRITSISSMAVRYDRNYSILPEEYHLRMSAQLFVYRADTGETLINGRTVSANDGAITRGDYQTGVMDALPRLSRLLAQNILEELQTIE